jgi:hypothetical protein
MTKVVLVGSDLSFSLDEMPTGDDESLAYLQGKVGGWVQAVDLQGKMAGFTLWTNEEGKMNGLPFNDLATLIWELSYGAYTDIIVGDCVITGGADEEGDTIGLDAEQIDYLEQIVKDALIIM